MGADGHIVIANREEFEKANPGVTPGDLGLYTGKVLGVEACWGYWGDNLFELNYGEQYMGYEYVKDASGTYQRIDWDPEKVEAARKALEWFEANSEDHEVWT